MDAQALAVLLDPRAQPRPLAQQGLVGDLHGSRGDREQALVGEQRDHPRGVLVARLELGERDAPALDGALGALAREPHEHAARDGLLCVVEPLERVLGEPRHRRAHAADALVVGVAQAPAVAALPELEQRRGQQGQRAGLRLGVRHERVGELGFDAQARAVRRELDRPAQLVATASA